MAPSHRAIPANERRVTQLDERTLADRERMLGADHPHTKLVRGNLAALTTWATGAAMASEGVWATGPLRRMRAYKACGRTTHQGRGGLSHVKEKLNGGQMNEAAPE